MTKRLRLPKPLILRMTIAATCTETAGRPYEIISRDMLRRIEKGKLEEAAHGYVHCNNSNRITSFPSLYRSERSDISFPHWTTRLHQCTGIPTQHMTRFSEPLHNHPF